MATEEFKAKNFVFPARARCLRVAAEERQALSELQEVQVLMSATEKGFKFTALELQTAVDLAKAARDNLVAEEKLIKLKVIEAKQHWNTLRDAAEAARTCKLEGC